MPWVANEHAEEGGVAPGWPGSEGRRTQRMGVEGGWSQRGISVGDERAFNTRGLPESLAKCPTTLRY